MAKNWRRKCLITLGILLTLTMVLMIAWRHFTSDEFVRARVLEAARASLNGEVDIESASLEVLRGIELRGVRIAGLPTLEGPGAPVIAIKRLKCNVNPWSYISGNLELREAIIEEPVVNLERYSDGKMNIVLLMRNPDERDRQAPRIDLFPGGVKLRQAQVSFRDEQFFADSEPRVLNGLDLDVMPGAATWSRFDFTGKIVGEPLRGAALNGWLREREAGQAPDFYLDIKLPALELSEATPLLFPRNIKEVMANLNAKGTVWGQVSLTVNPRNQVEFAASASVADAVLRPSWLPVEIEGFMADLRIDSRRMQSGLFNGHISGGAASGAFLLQFTGDSPRFELRANIAGADLARLAAKLGPQQTNLSGKADFSCEIVGPIHNMKALSGQVSCAISDARLAELPIFIGVLNVLNFELPSQPVFDRGRLRARINDGVIHLDEVWISSLSLEATARGTIDFEKNCNLIVSYASSKREGGEFLPIRLLRQGMHLIVGGIERTFLPPVRVTGPIDVPERLKYEVMIWEPVKRPLRDIGDIFQFLPFVGDNTEAPASNRGDETEQQAK